MMRRLKPEIVGSLFWMAIGFCFAVGAVRLDLGTFREPGAGLVPLILALILISFSLSTLAKELIRPVVLVSGIPWRRPALVIASVFFYGFLLDLVGFLLSTFILMSCLFTLLIRGTNKWLRVFAYAAATALVMWLVFSVALKVPFPSARLMSIWR